MEQRIRDALLTAMAPAGILAGRATVAQAATNLTIASYLGHLLHGEVLPGFAEYDDDVDELMAAADAVTEAFTDAFVDEPLAGLASVSRWAAHCLPVAVGAWQADREAPMTVLAFAALAALASGRGFDAERVAASGFVMPDDAALVETIRDAFDAEDVEGWLRAVIVGAGLFAPTAAGGPEVPDVAGVPEAAVPALAARLAADAAPHARLILDEGITVALKAVS